MQRPLMIFFVCTTSRDLVQNTQGLIGTRTFVGMHFFKLFQPLLKHLQNIKFLFPNREQLQTFSSLEKYSFFFTQLFFHPETKTTTTKHAELIMKLMLIMTEL